MKLIQLPTQAFEQRISQELEENPALEGGKIWMKPQTMILEQMRVTETYGQGNDVIETDINVDDYLSDDRNSQL